MFQVVVRALQKLLLSTYIHPSGTRSVSATSDATLLRLELAPLQSVLPLQALQPQSHCFWLRATKCSQAYSSTSDYSRMRVYSSISASATLRYRQGPFTFLTVASLLRLRLRRAQTHQSLQQRVPSSLPHLDSRSIQRGYKRVVYPARVGRWPLMWNRSPTLESPGTAVVDYVETVACSPRRHLE